MWMRRRFKSQVKVTNSHDLRSTEVEVGCAHGEGSTTGVILATLCGTYSC